MRSFFHGWRRKTGCVTLVLAMGMMGLWGRSLCIIDVVTVFRSQLVFQNGQLFWSTTQVQFDEDTEFWVTDSLDPGLDYIQPGDPEVDWSFHVPGFAMGWRATSHYLCYLRVISYWYFILSFTLLSAYLLLWQPRRRLKPDVASVPVLQDATHP